MKSHWMTPTFSPINGHLVICTQYLFGRRDLCSCLIEFCTKIESLTKWPPFFLQTEIFTKRPLLFYSPQQMTPFLLSSLKDPLFSLFSLSPKDPYFGGRVRTYPSLPYVSAPGGNPLAHIPKLTFKIRIQNIRPHPCRAMKARSSNWEYFSFLGHTD